VTLWIKVCGMRTAEAIHAAADAGAEAVGFVFHEASPRGLEPDLARELGAAVPAA
jgi:phosphoribosylanthranilate isomerase